MDRGVGGGRSLTGRGSDGLVVQHMAEQYNPRHGRRDACSTLVFGGVQSSGARAEDDVAFAGRLRAAGAVPQTGAAMHAFFAIEERDAVAARGDRLARAHLDAHFGGAALAEIGVEEAHVVGESGGAWTLPPISSAS